MPSPHIRDVNLDVTYRCSSGSREDDDPACVEIDRRPNRSSRDRLYHTNGPRSERHHLFEQADVRDRVLSHQASGAHLPDSQFGIVARGRLAAEHDTVSTVRDGVSDITDLSTGGARILDHALEHLGCADNRLAGNVAESNEFLLSSKDLRRRNLNAQIATGHHYAVGGRKNLLEVVQTLAVLNLGDNLDMLAILPENITDVMDISGGSDEALDLFSTRSQKVS